MYTCQSPLPRAKDSVHGCWTASSYIHNTLAHSRVSATPSTYSSRAALVHLVELACLRHWISHSTGNALKDCTVLRTCTRLGLGWRLCFPPPSIVLCCPERAPPATCITSNFVSSRTLLELGRDETPRFPRFWSLWVKNNSPFFFFFSCHDYYYLWATLRSTAA